MSEIHLRGTFPAIGRAELAEFTMLAEQVLAAVRAEPGVLQYDVFLSPDQARAVVLQRYADSDAVLSTLVATRPLIQRLAALAGGLDLEVFGNLSPQLQEVFAASHTASGAPVYSRLMGL